MTNCSCDTFNTTPITCNTFSTVANKFIQTGQGEAAYIQQTSYNYNALEVQSAATTQSGIWANCTSTGNTISASNVGGGHAISASTSGGGKACLYATPSGNAYGVRIVSSASTYGLHCANSAGNGAYFEGNGSYSIGVSISGYGTSGWGLYSLALGASGVAIYGGATENNGTALQGTATGQYGTAIYTSVAYSNAYAGYFNGQVYVGGYLNKAGGGFRIDHPTKPETHMLNHEFVEAEKAQNIYRGRAVLCASGVCEVVLPDYFTAANENAHAQVTVVGKPSLVGASEVVDGKFTIEGDAGTNVNWLVIADRADAWQKANHPGVEIEKKHDEKGKFLNPELFGKSPKEFHMSSKVRESSAN